VLSHYWTIFLELIQTPFQHMSLVWGIVPLYFALLLNELTSAKANYRTALQSGFSFLWAGAQWLYPWFKTSEIQGAEPTVRALPGINLFVTVTVLILGAVALVSGIRRRFPKYCSFLGYSRFSNYFMISIFPIQAHYLGWTWDRVAAIALFGAPIWMVLHFGLMPLRR
jgi:hypothetical protein